MPVIQCPNSSCGQRIGVSDEQRQATLRCPHCAQVFRLARPTDGAKTPDPPSATVDAAPPVPETPTADIIRIGRFEVRQRLGEGAFGVVYRAYDAQLDREVALKVAKPHMLNTEQRVKRFLREAKAAANLRHPNIVPVFDSGSDGEQYYIASAFIPGRSLAAALDEQPEGKGLDIRQAAEIVRRLAEALAYAHGKGVIHRDIKPANVMLDEDGVPLLMDFGLAARPEGDEKLTQEGTMMGTPAYMAPEQAAGKAEAASDQYSLGCTLYELLTGQTPFSGPPEIQLFLHQTQEPPPPQKVNPAVSRDLETICLKCLEKEAAKRYADCQALADDLRRWLEGEPIAARRLSLSERLVKLARRRPALVAACIFGGLALGLAGFSVEEARLKGQAETERQRAHEQRAEAQKARGLAEEARRDAERESQKAKDAEKKAREAEKTAKAEREKAVTAERETAYYRYVRQVDLAYRDWREGNVARARELLRQCDPGDGQRPWEWRFVQRLCHSHLQEFTGHTRGVGCVAFSPDGKRVISGGWPNEVKVWDAATGNETLSLKGHDDAVRSVAISGDGQRIVSGGRDNTVKVWDVGTGKELLTLKGHTDDVTSVAVSADGKRVVSGSYDQTVRVWNAVTGENLLTLKGHTTMVNSVVLSADGTRIVSGSSCLLGKPAEVKVWDAASGEELFTLQGDESNDIYSVALDASGRRIVTGSGVYPLRGEVKVWDIAGRKVILTLKGHTNMVSSVGVSPDGNRIISGSFDRTVKVWNAATGQCIRTFKGHTDVVKGVAFDASGTRIVSGSLDKTVKIWDATRGQDARSLHGHASFVTGVALSSDGKRLVSACVDQVKVWDADTGKELLNGNTDALSVAVNADGTRVGVGGFSRTVTVWDTITGQRLHTLSGHQGEVESVALSADGKRLVSGSTDKTVKLWDTETGRLARTLTGHTARLDTVALSADGKRLVSACRDMVRLWDADSGQLVRTLPGATGPAAISADGKRVMCLSKDRTLTVWDSATGQIVLSLQGRYPELVASMALSADGKRIISSSGATVKVWDASTGLELLTLWHSGTIRSVALSADGERIVSGGGELQQPGELRVWDATPIAPLPHTR